MHISSKNGRTKRLARLYISSAQGAQIIAIKLTGKTRAGYWEWRSAASYAARDYGQFVPEFEGLIQKHGKLRVLFVMKDFHEWELAALWEDFKFDARHFADLERVAMVGDKT